MTQRGIDFLRDWIDEHINADVYPTENDPRVKQMTAECLAAAVKQGIARKEIEEDTGSIEGSILGAMNAATNRDVDRLASKDD
jgi:hypothetical protein